MVVLDACRTDPFAPPPPGSASTKNVVDAATRAAFVKSLEVVARASYGTALINDAPVGTIVLYATASKDTAYDGVGGNGPLTKHFLRSVGIRGMTVEDLTKNVISGVQDETKRIFGRPQTPFVYQSFRNTFCFANCVGFDITRVPPTP
jgi:Caspase domain